jgi:hypothetical protein
MSADWDRRMAYAGLVGYARGCLKNSASGLSPPQAALDAFLAEEARVEAKLATKTEKMA